MTHPETDQPPAPDTTGYDPRTDTYHAHHDWTDNASVGTTIVNAVAALNGVAFDECEPVYDVIDPDALQAVLTPTADRSARAPVQVQFSYQGYTITVDSTGEIVIDAPDAPSHEPGQT
jgi:hypothetical protein